MSTLPIEEIYERLKVAFEALYEVRGNLDETVKMDTAFALGEALGTLSKAKALVGRDIDERRKPNAFETLKVEYWKGDA